MFLIVFAALVFFAPNYLGDPNNFIPANPLQTPADIVPEWYFLPYYAILRSVPNKLLGVCMMFGSLLVLFVLPWLDTSRVRSARFRPIYRQLIFVWVAAVIVLGICGAHKPEGIWVILSRVCTLYYFLHFLVILPILGKLERPLPLPESISQPVLGEPWWRTAARRRSSQADGESVMRKLRSLFAGQPWLAWPAVSMPLAGCLPRRRWRRKSRCRIRNGASRDSSGRLTSRPPTWLPDLFECLLQLPFHAVAALP